MKIAVLGGTGPQGRGLAMRWAKAGVEVIVGSRQREKGEKIAAELNAIVGKVPHPLRGTSNIEAARAADEFVVLTVPYAAHRATLESLKAALAGKVLIDVTVPLDENDPKRVVMPPEGSATEEAVAILGPEIPVVAAFQNVSAGALEEIEKPLHCDILVCGNDREAKKRAIPLIEKVGVRAYDVGPADQARCVEALTPILIRLNISKAYKIHHAGIRIVAGA